MRTNVFNLLSISAGIALAGTVSAQNVWNRTYGNGYVDRGLTVLQTPDEHIVAFGQSTQSQSQILWLKADSLGEPLSLKWVDWPEMAWPENAAVFMPDSGFIVAASAYSGSERQYDQLIIRMDANGDTIWCKTFGGPDWDFSRLVRIDSLNRIHIFGQTFSGENGQINWMVLDENGQLLSQQTISDASRSLDIRDVTITPEGNWLLGGVMTPGPYGATDIWAAVYDAALDSIWFKIYGTPGDDQLYSVSMYRNATNDLTYTLGGDFTHAGADQGFMFMQRIALNGDSILRVNLDEGGSLNYSRRHCKHAFLDNNGKYAVVCRISNTDESQPWGIEFTRTSFLFWESSSILYTGSEYLMNDFQLWKGGGYIVTGETDKFGPGLRALFITKTGPGGQGVNTVVTSNEEFASGEWKHWPNPASTDFYIAAPENMNWLLVDIHGRNAQVEPVYADGAWVFSIQHLAPGLYKLLGNSPAIQSTVYYSVMITH